MTDIEKICKAVQTRLFSMQDTAYGDFHSRLMPTVKRERIIGVRTPDLRKFAREFAKDPLKQEFMKNLPHYYYEENNLHGFLIEREKDFDTALEQINAFLPYIDNWATCDMTNPPVLIKKPEILLQNIKSWINSGKTYTVRYGVGMLMRHFLDERFSQEYMSAVAEIPCEEYYVHMMVAWYFATALDKQYNCAVNYIEKKLLPTRTHNMAIQKAVESRRIPKETKAYLKTLKIKES